MSLANLIPPAAALVRVVVSPTDVKILGPGGWMTAFRGPALGCENMGRAFAQVLGVEVETVEVEQ